MLDCVARDGNCRVFNVEIQQDDGGELGRLMHDFRMKEAKDMQSGALRDRVRELKETEKGVEHMCKEMEQLCDEREIEVKRETAKNLKDMGMSIEQIAQALKVNVHLIQDWLAGKATVAK